MRTWIEWLAIVALALLAAIAIKTWLVQAFYIPSASMVPTLQVGDRILVNKVSYDLQSIHRDDIVVFGRPPVDNRDPSVNDLVEGVVGILFDILFMALAVMLPGPSRPGTSARHPVASPRPLATPTGPA